MTWTPEKLLAFRLHFALTDVQIARAIKVTPKAISEMKCGHKDIKPYESRLTGYMEAVRAGKIREAEKMIEYYKSF